ncbi:MAG TPA: TetR/AcrR family transcriptional regulator [Actinoplanes sp.]|nr:TetR/AcrR family transcriptional regulator [Actinoplanes sp.]
MARPRKFDEAQVLDAVRDEFWARGYAATSLDDLMRATGLGKGSLYGAFGGKRELFLRVLGEYAGQRVDGARRALSGDGPAIDRLRNVFDPPENPDAGAGPPGRGCLLANSSTELAARDDEVGDCARRTYQAVEDLLAGVIEQAVAEGGLPATTEPRELARLLLAIQQGVEFLGKTGMEPGGLRQIGRSAATALLR